MSRALKTGSGVMGRYPLADYAETAPETARAAALTICDRADGPDDARFLLEVCGLAEYRRGQFTTYMFGRVRQP